MTIELDEYGWPATFSHVAAARYAGDYRIWLRFEDGVEGEADLSDLMTWDMFAPLRDFKRFKRFKVRYGTIIWSKQLDIAPESLYRRVLKASASTRPV